MEGRRGHTELVLLAILANGSAHGWSIVQQIRLRSKQIIDLGEGAVYPVLHKLQNEGILRSERADVDGRPRRVYSLTRLGEAELERRRTEWRLFARGMRSLLDGT